MLADVCTGKIGEMEELFSSMSYNIKLIFEKSLKLQKEKLHVNMHDENKFIGNA